MSETQSEQVIPKPLMKPTEAHTVGTLPATHRCPAVVWLIILLIALLVAVAGIAVVEAWKLLDLGAQIERLGFATLAPLAARWTDVGGE
jgi:hypothetical protein